MKDYKPIISKNIAALRKSVPITQAELAERIDYSEKAVSKWERGESLPDISVLKAIADIFGVSVDYLLEEEHLPDKAEPSRQLKINRILIAGMSGMLAVLIATTVFVALWLLTDIDRPWLAFVYAVPAVSIILLVFNSVWGRAKYNFIIISVLVWSVLACIYLTIGHWSSWLIFLIGVPGQVIICLWSGIKAHTFFVKKVCKKAFKAERATHVRKEDN